MNSQASATKKSTVFNVPNHLTALRLLLGFARPTAGRVGLRGGDPSQTASRRGVAYLPERLRLPRRMSVRALLRLHGRLSGLDGAELERVLWDDKLRMEMRHRAMQRAIRFRWSDAARSTLEALRNAGTGSKDGMQQVVRGASGCTSNGTA